MRQWWHNKNRERKHHLQSAHWFPGHCLVLHSRTGTDVKTQCAVGHSTDGRPWRLAGDFTWQIMKAWWGYSRLGCCGELWGLSTPCKFSLCGRTSLQAAKLIPEGNEMERANWLLRMLRVLVCTHPSFPCLLCNASLAVGNRSALKWDQESTGVSFLKAPMKCTLSPAGPSANVSGDFNVNLALFQCFSATEMKYFRKLHFVGGEKKKEKKIWDLDLFQFGVTPYVRFLEFPVGNTIFQPEGKTRLIGSRAWKSLCVTIFVLVTLQTNWSLPGL